MKLLKGQATTEQIATWKRENPKGVWFIASETDIAYFREPMRQDVSKALAESSDENPLQGIEKIGELLYIGGSKEILTDDQQFLSARFDLSARMKGIGTRSGNL